MINRKIFCKSRPSAIFLYSRLSGLGDIHRAAVHRGLSTRRLTIGDPFNRDDYSPGDFSPGINNRALNRLAGVHGLIINWLKIRE